MINVVEVWFGSYVGDGEYEGGCCSYRDLEGEYVNIGYEVESEEFEDLLNGLYREVDRLIGLNKFDNEELEVMKEDIEFGEKFIFTLDDGRDLEFEV